MGRVAAIRFLGLYVPVIAAFLLAFLRSQRKRIFPAALMGFVWTLPSLLAVQLLNLHFGWWQFHAQGGLFRGMPVDLFLGWAVLWGILPILTFHETGMIWVTAVFFGADLIFMPACFPVVALGHRWLIGEFAAIGLVLLPAQLFARWTLDDTHLRARAIFHVLAAGGVFLFLIPEVGFALQNGRGWDALLSQPSWLRSLELQAIALLGVLGVSAVQEFAQRGEGTPIPYDPPKQLVISGFYRYVSNPMQLSCALVMTAWGGVLRDPWLSLGGVISFLYSLGLAAWDEGEDMKVRFGKPWEEYRNNVHAWIPRMTPWHASDRLPARLYIAETCGPCSEVRRWFESRNPVALDIVAAEDHPTRGLQRITYDPMDGTGSEEGVCAFARGLEHINLGWAFAGACLRLPGIAHVVQILLDSSGLGPRVIPRRSCNRCRPSQINTRRAHQTQKLEITSALSQAGLASAAKTFNGSFNLVSNIKPGDLLLAGGSVDQSNTYVFEVVPRVVSESGSRSFQYWSTGNGDDTMVTLWNPADEAQDFVLTLFFAVPDGSRGHYVLPLHLEARVSRTFNVSEIVQNQIPDAEGNTIPASVHEGGIKIAGSQAENQHILIVAEAGIYNVRKATCGVSCGQCDGYTSAAVLANPFAVAVNGTTQLNFMGTWNSGSQYNLGGTWSSNQTSVATVGSGTGLVTGMSPGSATISALVYNEPTEAGYICYGGGGCPVHNFGGGSGGNIVAVTVSQRLSGSISSDNAAASVYTSTTGTSSLGLQTSVASGFKACFAGMEFVGAVNPSNYTALIQLRRRLLSCGTYINSSTSLSCGATPRDDTSGAANRDDDPQSGGSAGKIYDWDTPGVENGTTANSVYRYRANFSEWATDPNSALTLSNFLNFFVRLSCKFDASGNPSLDTTVSGDNQVGAGTTNVTWNLQ